MKQKISIQEYIANNNVPYAQKMLKRYGIAPAKSNTDLERKLVMLTKDHKEQALKDLVDIHPDKDLILKYSPKEESHQSFCGCSGFDGSTTPVVPVKTAEPVQVIQQPAHAGYKLPHLTEQNLGIILLGVLAAVAIVAMNKH